MMEIPRPEQRERSRAVAHKIEKLDEFRLARAVAQPRPPCPRIHILPHDRVFRPRSFEIDVNAVGPRHWSRSPIIFTQPPASSFAAGVKSVVNNRKRPRTPFTNHKSPFTAP